MVYLLILPWRLKSCPPILHAIYPNYKFFSFKFSSLPSAYFVPRIALGSLIIYYLVYLLLGTTEPPFRWNYDTLLKMKKPRLPEVKCFPNSILVFCLIVELGFESKFLVIHIRHRNSFEVGQQPHCSSFYTINLTLFYCSRYLTGSRDYQSFIWSPRG